MIEKKFDGIMFNAGAWPPDPRKPSIIFIHGAGNTKSLWDEQVDALSDIANTIAIDLPGHGGSGGEGKNEVKAYAAAVEEFIESIKAPSPVICGLSLGGAITLEILIHGKGIYKAAILMNTGAKLKVHPMVFDTIKNNYGGFVTMAVKTAISEKTDSGKVGHIIDDWKKCDPETVYGDFDACNKFDLMNRVNSVSIPVLIITSEDDKLTPAKYGIQLSENIKNSRRVHITGCGHLSPAEKPDDVNSAIKNFIADLK